MGFSILIVDDSAITRAVIKRTILMSGLPDPVIHEAEHGRAGLAAAAQFRPDLILADLQMPEMDGLEMTLKLLADPGTRSIPVVVVSAEPSTSTIARLREAGVRGHVAKPFTPETISRVIKETLGGIS